jgi:hypothetical protein
MFIQATGDEIHKINHNIRTQDSQWQCHILHKTHIDVSKTLPKILAWTMDDSL